MPVYVVCQVHGVHVQVFKVVYATNLQFVFAAVGTSFVVVRPLFFGPAIELGRGVLYVRRFVFDDRDLRDNES